MKYLEYDLGVCESGQAVRVTLEGNAANVQLVDPTNRSRYKAGREFQYYGGHFDRSPAVIGIPRSGHWYVMVDFGGYAGSANVSVEVI